MNTEKNLRYRETDEKIKQAYRALLREEPEDKITVSAICRRIGINRSSFYLHYLDLEDLNQAITADLEEALHKILMKTFHNPLNVHIYTTEYLRFIKDHQELFSLIDYKIPHDRQIARNFQKIGGELGVKDQTELEYHMSFFFGGLENLATAWVRNGCREEPEYIMKIIDDEYHRFSQTFKFRV